MISRFEQFTSAISSIHRSIQKIEREQMEKYGLKGVYAQYLVTIQRYKDGITAAQLCEVCDLDKAAVSRTVAEMTQRGLLERVCANETGYRARLKLTDKGQEAADYVNRLALTAVEAAGKALTDESRAVMYTALESIAAELSVICKEGIPESK